MHVVKGTWVCAGVVPTLSGEGTECHGQFCVRRAGRQMASLASPAPRAPREEMELTSFQTPLCRREPHSLRAL